MLHIHPHAVQRPTHARLHVRDLLDAHVLLEAVRLGRLQPVTRRLNEVERTSFIRSGSVFVWEESEDDLGLRRWTDGLLWSASRMREPFLYYESRNSTPSSKKSSLVKQTYSAIVTIPNPSPGQEAVLTRKWHLTAYFDFTDVSSLSTIDDDPMLRAIVVPSGIYRSGKSRQSSRQQRIENTSSSSASRPYRWMHLEAAAGIGAVHVPDRSQASGHSLSPSDQRSSSPSSPGSSAARSSVTNSPELPSNYRLPPPSELSSPQSPTSPFSLASASSQPSRSSSSPTFTRHPASHSSHSSSSQTPFDDPYSPASPAPLLQEAPSAHLVRARHTSRDPQHGLPSLGLGFAPTSLSHGPPGRSLQRPVLPRRPSGSSEMARTREDERLIELLNSRASIS